MRVLFIMMHPGYLRNFESVIRLLSQRGHEIHLRFNRPNKQASDRQAERLVEEVPHVCFDPVGLPDRRDYWKAFARLVRGGLDYLLYFYPQYARAHRLRQRMELKVEALLWKPFFRIFLFFFPGSQGVRRLVGMFRRVERLIPAFAPAVRLFQEIRPDLVLVTPLVNFASDQTDYVRAARHLGIRHALCVASWDNLTNKGIIRGDPDRLLVWNEFQREEAEALHAIDPGRVWVTGAQCFDKWFGRVPSAPKAEFLRKIGLRSSGYVLYLCSSPFIAPKEVDFVRHWVSAIRASSDPVLAGMGILIRPHPQNAAQWQSEDFSEWADTVIYPREGANPVTAEARADFFDSLFHAHAVVGVNSSAMIEAGILNKPVLTILDPEFAGSQEGTLHFHHLVRGKLLAIASSISEHLHQLSVAFSRDPFVQDRRRFVKDFLRPRGEDLPATPIFVDCLEAYMLVPPPVPDTWTWRHGLARVAAGVAAIFLASPYGVGMFVVRPFRKKFHQGKKTARIMRLKLRSGGLSWLVRGIGRRVFPWLPWVAIFPGNGNPPRVSRAPLEALARSSKPVLVGPWLSEVGFELLYWVPFVQWLVQEFKIPRERLMVVSRGGVASWYQGVADRYVDLFSHYSEADFRQRNAERTAVTGGQKHTAIGHFDHHIVNVLQDSRVLEKEFEWIHPSLMYNLFKYYWTRQGSAEWIERHTRYLPLRPLPRQGAVHGLPESYVAAKFYFSESFPDTEENRLFVRDALRGLARRENVVLLNTGLAVDDHRDSLSVDGLGVYSLNDAMTLANNLHLQTQAICGAKAFYGTYGGFSYLAPFFGVPSVGFYSREDKFLPVHLDIAHRAFRSMKFGRFDKIKEPRPNPAPGRPEFMAVHTRNVGLFAPLVEGSSSHALVLR
jgi:hypothetical protein